MTVPWASESGRVTEYASAAALVQVYESAGWRRLQEKLQLQRKQRSGRGQECETAELVCAISVGG